MRNIIKNALRSPQPTATQAAMSRGKEETSASIASQTKYSKQMTPSQRKAEAVKRELDNKFAASSSDSAEESSGREKKKKRKMIMPRRHNFRTKKCAPRPSILWTL